MFEMIIIKIFIFNMIFIFLVDGCGLDVYIFRSLVLVVMFFCIDSMDCNFLICWFSLFVLLDLIGVELIVE